jgi:protoheme IX farnesyltransferase
METSVTYDSAAPSGEDSRVTAQRVSVKDYIQITKPGIVRSNLFVIFTGFWLASSSLDTFSWLLLLFTMAGGTLIMAGSCVLNNYLDRDLDIRMERTKRRAIAEGRISPRAAFGYGMILIILGTALLAFGANVLAAFLGFIGVFVYVVVYTAWMKRTSHLNTVVGAVSGAMPPLIGWTAVTGSLGAGAWALFAFLFFWQIPHFLALAILKSEDYRIAGYQMLPVVTGLEETKRQVVRWAAALLPASLLLYGLGLTGTTYFITALILGIGWIALCTLGFFVTNHMKWARYNFIYSLVYLLVMCTIMMVDAL